MHDGDSTDRPQSLHVPKAVPAVRVCDPVQSTAQVRHIGGCSRRIVLWPHPPVSLPPRLQDRCLLADDVVVSAKHRHPGHRTLLDDFVAVIVIEVVDDAEGKAGAGVLELGVGVTKEGRN